jgi:hypothetical protein
MLGERRLAQVHGVREVADRHLTGDRQPTQDQQPVFIGEQLSSPAASPALRSSSAMPILVAGFDRFTVWTGMPSSVNYMLLY